MSIAQLLSSIPPRERAGARSANRFDYQLDWALCRLLELHRTGNDYVILIDYHDDVLVLDSATDPQSVYCYQIKTKGTGNWTRTMLLKQKRGETGMLPSILGKLYQHVQTFHDPVKLLCFVSNAYLKLNHGSADETTEALDDFVFDSLEADERAAILDALAAECGVATNCIELVKFRFSRSTLAPQGHPDQALGKLVNFLEEIPEAHAIPGPAFYRTLKQELARAFHYEGTPGDFESLCACKSITRKRFVEMLAKGCAEPRRAEHADIISSRLDGEGVAFATVGRVRLAVRQYVVERLNTTDTLLIDHTASLRQIVQGANEESRLWDTIETVRQLPAVQDIGIEQQRGIAYCRAMIGVLLYESGELPSADPQAAETET
jgi:hypothetical protein